MTQVLTFTSGKGGVGKSTLIANTAIELSKQGQRVLLLDGDFGMANLDLFFRVRPRKTVESVISGVESLTSILEPVAPEVWLIPGGTGVYELQSIVPHAKLRLLDEVSELAGLFDFMLIDTAPGISDHVLFLNSAASQIQLILTPDPASMTDAYALIKVLHQRHRETRFQVICNQVRDESDGRALFHRFESVVSRFLTVQLEHKASIPTDPHIRQAVRSNQLVCDCAPDAPSARAIKELAQTLIARRMSIDSIDQHCDSFQGKGSLQFFWKHMVGAVPA